jgi:hypothetical protein
MSKRRDKLAGRTDREYSNQSDAVEARRVCNELHNATWAPDH